jgi:hypothetical protein
MKRFWIALTLCCMTAAAYAQMGTEITIRLISSANGKPMSHRPVLVYRIDSATHEPIVQQGLPLKGTTDEEGKVSFPDTNLRSKIPRVQGDDGGTGTSAERHVLSKVLDVQIIYAGGGIQCSTGLFSLDEILKSGVVGDNHCDKKFDSTKFKATAGEVLIFVGKYHWWESGQT